jgi:hypothetical protein
VFVNGEEQPWSGRVPAGAATSAERAGKTLPAGAHALEAPVFFYRASDRTRYPGAFTLRVLVRDSAGTLLASGERHVQIA